METQKENKERVEKDINEIYAEAIELQKEYVYLREPVEYDILMLWNMQTWMYKDFGVTPYIKLYGTKGSGKTAIMEFSKKFVNKGVNITDCSKAGIFGSIDQVWDVLYFDEFESMSKNDPYGMENIFNSGYKAGGSVIRCSGPNFEPKEFKTFGPKMVATVKDVKSDTMNDRFIEMITSKAGKKMKQVNMMRADDKEKIELLKKKLSEWISANKERILDNFDKVIDLKGRDYELLGPLVSIAKELGKETAVRDYYFKQRKEYRDVTLDNDWQYNLLVALESLTTKDKTQYSVKTITEAFRTVTKMFFVKEKKIGQEMRKLGFDPEPRQSSGYYYILNKEDVIKAIHQKPVQRILQNKPRGKYTRCTRYVRIKPSWGYSVVSEHCVPERRQS